MEIASDSKPIRKKYFIAPIVILLTVIYLGFLLYQAIFMNYQTNVKIKALNRQLDETKREQRELEVLIAYYKTSAFQELEARKKLGLKMPGEKVVKVDVPQEQKKSKTEEAKVASEPTKTNPQLWYEYLFYQDF